MQPTLAGAGGVAEPAVSVPLNIVCLKSLRRGDSLRTHFDILGFFSIRDLCSNYHLPSLMHLSNILNDCDEHLCALWKFGIDLRPQTLDRSVARDVLSALLHAILFHRLFGVVHPRSFDVLDVTFVSFVSLAIFEMIFGPRGVAVLVSVTLVYYVLSSTISQLLDYNKCATITQSFH